MGTAKLSSKGEIVVPKSVREARSWREGTEFIVETTADGVVLRTKKPASPASRERVSGMLQYKARPRRWTTSIAVSRPKSGVRTGDRRGGRAK
jgi:AbrB family looped-hinge helix DNA binding protein